MSVVLKCLSCLLLILLLLMLRFKSGNRQEKTIATAQVRVMCLVWGDISEGEQCRYILKKSS